MIPLLIIWLRMRSVPVEIQRQRRPLTTCCVVHRATTMSKNWIGAQLDSRRTSMRTSITLSGGHREAGNVRFPGEIAFS
jgi:hypothetical protein